MALIKAGHCAGCVLDDIAYPANTTNLSNASIIGCLYHASSNTVQGIQLTGYKGKADGSDNTLFTDGSLTKVLDASGAQVGSGNVFQPYLYTPNGSYSAMVPLKEPKAAVLGNGVRTLFDPNASPVLFAYFNHDQNAWYKIASTSNPQ